MKMNSIMQQWAMSNFTTKRPEIGDVAYWFPTQYQWSIESRLHIGVVNTCFNCASYSRKTSHFHILLFKGFELGGGGNIACCRKDQVVSLGSF